MAVKGSEGTINLSIFFVTTILTTTDTVRFRVIFDAKLSQLIFRVVFNLFLYAFRHNKVHLTNSPLSP